MAAAAPADSGANRTWHLKFSLPANSMINGTNPLGLLDELREMGECKIEADIESIPDLAALDPRELYFGWTVTLTTDKGRSDIEDVFIFVMDDMVMELDEQPSAAPQPAAKQAVAAGEPVKAAPAANETAKTGPADAKGQKAADNVRIPAERLDEMMDRVGELVIAQSRLGPDGRLWR